MLYKMLIFHPIIQHIIQHPHIIDNSTIKEA